MVSRSKMIYKSRFLHIDVVAGQIIRVYAIIYSLIFPLLGFNPIHIPGPSSWCLVNCNEGMIHFHQFPSIPQAPVNPFAAPSLTGGTGQSLDLRMA